MERGTRPPSLRPTRACPGTARLDGQCPARHAREYPFEVDREPGRLVVPWCETDLDARQAKAAAFEPGGSRGARKAGRACQRGHTGQGSARLRYTPGIFQPGARLPEGKSWAWRRTCGPMDAPAAATGFHRWPGPAESPTIDVSESPRKNPGRRCRIGAEMFVVRVRGRPRGVSPKHRR